MDYRAYLNQMQEQQYQEMMAELAAQMPKPSMEAPQISIDVPQIETPQTPDASGMSANQALGLMNFAQMLKPEKMAVPNLQVIRGGGAIPAQAPPMNGATSSDIIGLLQAMGESGMGAPTSQAGLLDMLRKMYRSGV
jgi:hypothetical protein